MMPVIVNHGDTVLSPDLKSPVRTSKAFEPVTNLFRSEVQFEPDGYGSECILNIMAARNVERERPKPFALGLNHKDGLRRTQLHFRNRNVRSALNSVTHHGTPELRQQLLQQVAPGRVGAGDYGAEERHFIDEGDKGRGNLVEIAIMVQVLPVYVGDYGNGRQQVKKGPIALIRFHDHKLALAQPRARAES